MDKIINWFLLVIIFVFDPLAISLVIAANFAFNQIKKKPEVIENKPSVKPNFVLNQGQTTYPKSIDNTTYLNKKPKTKPKDDIKTYF